ncbi:hypothetical protein SUGI_0411270 [Cryptomeria japonica]|uniref:acyltransferase GLAUCE n=1 Tax=Cryptomeria japonica TaxID=3369 RepID=UPI00240898BA|nr:acyltransferase GLAUCE [Cryptomeria japonica]GLJ21959.1 hypothetical protein SUGI_0411270 [Cryptomeria japonica]
MAVVLSPPTTPCYAQVRVEETITVYPAQPTERKTMFLSNLDQQLVFTVETVHFFAPNPAITSSEATQMIRDALSKLLVTYDFIAGRLEFDSHERRLQIDCCGAGALFASASTNISLSELHDIAYPNPFFKNLVLQQCHQIPNLQDLPLCFVQVTRFECGGFSIGLGTNHTVMDGMSAVTFMKNLASLASTNTLAIIPYTDRSSLKARSPPLIEYQHPELYDHQSADSSALFPKVTGSHTVPSHNIKSTGHIFKLFRLSADFVMSLKKRAMADGRVAKCTGFEAVTAHLWKCRTEAVEMQEKEEPLMLLFAVDVRGRMNPGLPSGFVGNAAYPAYTTANTTEIKKESLSLYVEKVKEGIGRVSDKYVQSGIDWREVNKKSGPRMEGTFIVSSWWKLGFEDVEYPWGKPLHYGPVLHEKVNIVLLLPNNVDRNGVHVFLALLPHQMPKFEQLFLTPEQ